MARKKTPPWNGLSPGPMMVACQWNRSSPMGPAEHDDGGSLQVSQSVCVCSVVPPPYQSQGCCPSMTSSSALSWESRIDIPTKVCEFFVDTLQRHCGGFESSARVSRFETSRDNRGAAGYDYCQFGCGFKQRDCRRPTRAGRRKSRMGYVVYEGWSDGLSSVCCGGSAGEMGR